jgi:hypothetical protein
MSSCGVFMAEGIMMCTCDDWFEGMKNLDVICVTAHQQGVRWLYKGFSFCPWCGNELQHKEVLM